jgi:hypothetical protein
VFVGWAEEDVDVLVAFVVLFRDMEEPRAVPDRRTWEGVLDTVDWLVPLPVPLLATIIEVPTPNNVVDPRVVVRVVDPLVIVETMAEVVIAEAELLVMVEAYEI